jgi:hypothetical protein
MPGTWIVLQARTMREQCDLLHDAAWLSASPASARRRIVKLKTPPSSANDTSAWPVSRQ